MKPEVKEFLESYKAMFGSYVAPMNDAELSPEQLERMAAEVERLPSVPPMFHNERSRQLVKLAMWMERLSEMKAWDFINRPHVEFEDFMKYYTEKYGTLLHPISDKLPTDEQVEAAEMLFKDIVDSVGVVNQLRKVNDNEKAMELVAKWWMTTLKGHKRACEKIQEMIRSGEIDKPECLDEDEYAVLVQ